VAPRDDEEAPDDEDEGEEVGSLDEDDDAWTEEVAEDARLDLDDDAYARATAPEPPVGWIIAVVIVAALAVALVLLR
jgi:hypothetical protein